MERIESAILNSIIHSEKYFRKVFPHLKKEYFYDKSENVIFSIVAEHSEKYSKPIDPKILFIKINELTGLDQDDYTDCVKYYENYIKEPENFSDSFDALVDSAEKFCKDMAIFNGLTEAVAIHEGRRKGVTSDAIPSVLTQALSVSFDAHIGHSYTEQAEERYDRWNRRVHKVPFNLEYLNLITGGTKDGRNGGFEPGTLNLVVGGPGSGKTVFLGHIAADYISQGKNVLYITLEMSEENIAKRIDANIMDIDINEIHKIPKINYISKFEKMVKGGLGNLIVKEYPTASGSVNHFRALIDELKIKKGFVPDLICVDYLNICASSRIGMASGSYTYVKSISEEVRGLGQENNVPILSAVQFNRSGIGASDVDLNTISDSAGIGFTADWFLALIRTDELNEMGVVLAKQLKNRYADVTRYNKFYLGLDTNKMKFFNCDQDKDDEENDTPLFDKSTNNSYNEIKF